MVSRTERFGWIAAFATILVLSIPWFLWGSDAVALGLPVWLWWHVGWMALTAVAFWVFTQRAWGIGIEEVQHG